MLLPSFSAAMAGVSCMFAVRVRAELALDSAQLTIGPCAVGRSRGRTATGRSRGVGVVERRRASRAEGQGSRAEGAVRCSAVQCRRSITRSATLVALPVHGTGGQG